MRFHDALTGAVLLAVAIALLVYSLTLPAMPGQQFGPGAFPLLVAVGLGICSVLLIVRTLAAGNRGQPLVAIEEGLRSSRGLAAVATVIAGTLFYLLAADDLGFLIVAPLVLLALFRSQRIGWAAGIAIAIVASVAIHFAFYKMLRVPLPWGLLTPIAW